MKVNQNSNPVEEINSKQDSTFQHHAKHHIFGIQFFGILELRKNVDFQPYSSKTKPI